MELGGARYANVGGVHAIPVEDARGRLVLCGLEAIGPDPAGLLTLVEAETVVCLQTSVEIERRHPDYLRWLDDPDPYEALRLPTEDHLVAADDAVVDLVGSVHARLGKGRGVVVHCGAGWGRAGVIAVLVMCAAGAEIDPAIRELRFARPAAGPQSAEQDLQIDRLASRVRAEARSA